MRHLEMLLLKKEKVESQFEANLLMVLKETGFKCALCIKPVHGENYLRHFSTHGKERCLRSNPFHAMPCYKGTKANVLRTCIFKGCSEVIYKEGRQPYQ